MSEQNSPDQEKFLREDLSDLKEYAQRVLSQKGDLSFQPIMEIPDWNIRNWGNYYGSDFYNH